MTAIIKKNISIVRALSPGREKGDLPLHEALGLVQTAKAFNAGLRVFFTLSPQGVRFCLSQSGLEAAPFWPMLPFMSQSAPDSDLKSLEQAVLDAALPKVADLGFSQAALNAAVKQLGLSDGARDLAFPNGAQDLAALLWRRFDAVFDETELTAGLSNLKIREKIARLLTARLDRMAEDEIVAKRLVGFLTLPQNLGLHQRLIWATADRLWKLAGDQSTDENHYSKRLIAEGILATAAVTRLMQGREAMLKQIDDNIAAVMAYEKFKAKLPVKPEKALLDIASAIGKLRFGKTPSPVKDLG